MTKTLLIDGDILAYRTAAAVQTTVDWGNDIWSVTGNLKEAQQVFVSQMDEWREAAECSEVKLAYTSYPTFRHEIYPDYKANRSGTVKPILYRPLIDWSCEEYPHLQYAGLEADDLLGLNQRDDTVIASADKDLRTVPGSHLDLEALAVETVSEDEANARLFAQALTGDATDGYSGLKGVGPKTADKILDGCVTEQELWTAVVDAYVGKGCTAEDALLSVRLARILRQGEYDSTTDQPILWEPRYEQAAVD